jgi:hypothetical protein
VHDRRIDGKTQVFGNAGSLFMTAMTWYDHETTSIWSQPWGRALSGELKGVELFLLPSQVTTWGGWLEEHPDTLLMTNDLDRLGARRQGFSSEFVIGLILDGESNAYRFSDVLDAGLIQDELAGFPILVWAADTRFHAYLRSVDGMTLNFELQGEQVRDLETGSTWDIARGLALDGPFKGEVLQQIPGSTSYDWAWQDFYPTAKFYRP